APSRIRLAGVGNPRPRSLESRPAPVWNRAAPPHRGILTMSHRPALLLALGVLAMITPAHVTAAQNPRELGLVRWGRSLDAVRAESRSSGRPVLLLFQEIPGCKTCVDFGQGPLSNPLLVEAIESEFVPVAIYNNRAGADADLL